MKSKNTLTKRLLAAVIAVMVALSVITVPQTRVSAATGKIQSISVANLPAKQLTLKKGKTFTLKTKVKTSGSISKALIYKTSNPSVATVSSRGKIKAKKNGKATITIISKANTKKKTSIKLTVGTPVTRVKLNKASANVPQNSVLKLTATVTPNKASEKRVIWTSSNKKVATVSSSGIVKGIKPGKSTITATARDGSGRKKTCKITVTNPVKIASAKMIGGNAIMLTLSSAYKCTAADFDAYIKQTSNGTYRQKMKVSGIQTSDNKNYIVTFQHAYIDENNTIKISIPKLATTKEFIATLGKYNSTQEAIISRNFSNTYNSSTYVRLNYKPYGYTSISATGLPEGLECSISGSSLYVSGYYNKVGKFNSQIVVTDELGNKSTVNLTILVGDTNHLYAHASNILLAASNNSSDTATIYATAIGGSGSYNYEITGANPIGATVSDSGYIYVPGCIPGTHTINVKVTDQSDASLTTTFKTTVQIKKAITVSGVVTTMTGDPIPNAMVYFVDEKDNNNDTSAGTDFYGMFEHNLLPSTYTIKVVYRNTTYYMTGQKITSNKYNLQIKLPLHKVIVTNFPNAKVKWYDEKGNTLGSGPILYLPSGVNKLKTAVFSNGLNNYQASFTINVSSAASVTAKLTNLGSSVKGSIKEDEQLAVQYISQYTYYKFTPETSGTYEFYTTDCSLDDYGTLRDAQGKELARNDDGGTGYNFLISYYCNAGSTYYVGVRTNNTSTPATGRAVLNVTKTAASN